MVKLIFKEAIFNLGKKMGFYLSFFCFLILASGMIIGLLSFGLNFSNQIGPVIDNRTPTHQISFYQSNEQASLSSQGLNNINNLIKKKNSQPVENFFNSNDAWNLNYDGGFLTKNSTYEKFLTLDQNLQDEINFYSRNIFIWYFFNDDQIFKNEKLDFSYSVRTKATVNVNSNQKDFRVYSAWNKSNFFYKNNDNNFTVFQGEKYSEEGIYITPRTANDLNLKIGDELNFEINSIFQTAKIVGFAIDSKTITQQNSSLFITKNIIDNINNQKPEDNFYRVWDFNFSVNKKINFTTINKEINQKLFSSKFNIINPKEDQQEISIDKIVNTFLPLSLILISFLIVIVLCSINWMVTSQSSELNLKNLIVLKDSGISNFKLSLLNTFEILIPLVLATIIGTFLGLLFQNIISKIVFEEFSIYWNFWFFTWITLIIVISVITIILGSFAIINFYIIKNILRNYNNHKVTKTVQSTSKFLRNVKSRQKINTVVQMSNFRKNISMFLLTAISLTSFLVSVSITAQMREKQTQMIKLFKPFNSFSYKTNNNPTNFDQSSKYLLLDKSEFNDVLTKDDVQGNNLLIDFYNLNDFVNQHYSTDLNKTPGYIDDSYIVKFVKSYQDDIQEINPSYKKVFDQINDFKTQTSNAPLKIFFGKYFIEDESMSGLKRNFLMTKNQKNISVIQLEKNSHTKMLLPDVDYDDINNQSVINISMSARAFIDGKYELGQMIGVNDLLGVNWSNKSFVINHKFKIAKVIWEDVSIWNTYVNADAIYDLETKFLNENNINYDYDYMKKTKNFVLSASEIPFFMQNIVLNVDNKNNNHLDPNKFEIDRGFNIKEMGKEFYNRSKIIRETLNFIAITLLFVDFLIIILLSSMVVYQNKRILSVLKTIGYKKIELIEMIGTGYFISIICGLILAIVLNEIFIRILSIKVKDVFGPMEVIYNWTFILINVILILIYLIIVFGTIVHYIKIIKNSSNPE